MLIISPEILEEGTLDPANNRKKEMLTKNKLKQINKDGWYWAQGSSVMCNYGDPNTFTFCMCRNHAEAHAVALGLNVLDWNESNEE